MGRARATSLKSGGETAFTNAVGQRRGAGRAYDTEPPPLTEAQFRVLDYGFFVMDYESSRIVRSSAPFTSAEIQESLNRNPVMAFRYRDAELDALCTQLIDAGYLDVFFTNADSNVRYSPSASGRDAHLQAKGRWEE